ncbi:hypothetical protein ABIB62_001289 [Mucilaginibacter sp. UYP25]
MVRIGTAYHIHCYTLAVLAIGTKALSAFFLTHETATINKYWPPAYYRFPGRDLFAFINFYRRPFKIFWARCFHGKSDRANTWRIILLFIVNTVSAGVEQKWKWETTGKVLLACIIPFGTFYIDKKILRNIKPV